MKFNIPFYKLWKAISELSWVRFQSKPYIEIYRGVGRCLPNILKNGHLFALQDRDQFAALVRDVAAPDVGRMGIEILSFTIKDVYDRVEYLNSLGRAQTAVVKRDADIGVAEAERDAGIKEAECDRAKLDVRYAADTHIANSTRDFQMQKASFDQEVNTARAEAELAYQLQATKEKQKIRTEEVNISIVERRKQIEIEEKEILCSEKKMDATVRRPAEVEAYRLQQIAEGHRQRKILLAQAEADGIRARGHANAASILAIGNAEAERMKLRADAYNKYGEAAMLSLILDSLPRVAAEVAAPLSRTKEIVIMGGSCGNGSSGTMNQLTSLGRDFATMMGTVPQAVRALTDVDLSKVIISIFYLFSVGLLFLSRPNVTQPLSKFVLPNKQSKQLASFALDECLFSHWTE
ncbi:flotillin [Paragonimus westermani]|uniref:Flotillin n=1 Tax=Paragonimus westermani TaxID=34504 RepID=A0A5J4NCS1_9TREM|nr:flotillin [Paragonimus westermani]